MLSRFKTPIICVAIPLLVGAVSAFLTKDAMAQFDMLNKPALTPPSSLFPIVWTILFILMGIASYLVYMSSDVSSEDKKMALTAYGVQLFMNLCWSIVFFNFGWYLFAFLWIILLWFVILYTTVQFWRISKPAGCMLIPYLLWVAFAAYLNYMIWQLN